MKVEVDLSICIAAYNNNRSLKRALDSIKKQSIASQLNVLVSDDCSPIEIDINFFDKYKAFFNDFRIVRQHINLGVLSNAEWLFNNIKTSYYTYLQHDDVICDQNFYQRALQCFSENEKLVCYLGNSVILDSNENIVDNDNLEYLKKSQKMYDIENPKVVGVREDCSISGENLIKNITNKKIKFNASWSAVIFKRKSSLVVGGFGGGYTLSKGEAAQLNVYREEEHFALLHLLCCMGECQLEKKPSVIRIIESTSFSKSRTHPAIIMTQDSCLFAMYKLASVIEYSFDNHSSEKIIRLILAHISNIPLKWENMSTRKFFKTYQLKNKKYHKELKTSLNKSRRLKSKFEVYYLLKAYLRYYKNIILEKYIN